MSENKDKFPKNTRVVVTDGLYAGRRGRFIRADGQLRGQPVSMVKFDDSFGGTSVETRFVARESEVTS